MKKTIILSLTFLLALCFFAGCEQDTPQQGIASDVIESYDSESRIEIDETSEPTGSANETDTHGLTVKDKRYTYDGSDLVILKIENHTQKDYSVTVNGNYLDAEGNNIKGETRVFKGLEAGASAQMLFMPEITFDRFTYTVSVSEHDGDYLQSRVHGLDWNEDTAQFKTRYGLYTGYESQKSYQLYTKYSYTNNNEIELYVTGNIILFDKSDNILTIQNMGYIRTQSNAYGGNDMLIYSSYDHKLTDNRETWPEEFRDGLTMLFIPYDVMSADELPEDFFS